MPSDTQRPPPVRKELLERFKDDVRERYGKVRGHYGTELERAIESYLEASKGGDVTHRLEQIENDLADIKGALSEQPTEKEKRSGSKTVTEKRLEEIKETIREESGDQPKVNEMIVNKAIREIAGSSDQTVEKYHRLLREDNELFDHPTNSKLYFRDAGDFVKATNALAKGGKIDSHEYQSLLDEYGEEWWVNQLEDETQTQDNGRKGFQ